MDLFKIVVHLIIICVLLQLVAADVIVGVDIRNVPPVVDNLTVTSYVILGSETDILESKAKVWCNTTVTDLNGFKDIIEVEALLWHTEHAEEESADDIKNHYSPAISVGRPLNITSRKISYGFELLPSAIAGKWKCRVSTKDKRGVLRKKTDDVTVYANLCHNQILDEGEVLIDCGGSNCPACLMVDPIFIQVPAGLSRNTTLNIRSTSGELISVSAITKTALTTGIFDLSSDVLTIMAPDEGIEPYSNDEVNVVIRVPDDAGNLTYTGIIKVYTNNTVSQTTFISLQVLPAIVGDLNIIIEKTCLSNPVDITVKDSETGKRLDDVLLRFYYRGDAVTDVMTDESGVATTSLYHGGTYIISARKDEYTSIEKFFSILQCEIAASCKDGIKNGDESDIDCGEGCQPCTCFNGLQDDHELGIDCGGPCDLCPTHIVIPELFMQVTGQMEDGGNINVQVKDKNGNLVPVLLKILPPDGKQRQLRTDSSGSLVIPVDAVGMWQINALRAGYRSAMTKVLVNESAKKPLFGGLSFSIPDLSGYVVILIILLLVVIIYQKKWRA